MQVTVFISGRGSNLSALLQTQSSNAYTIAHVISDNSSAAGLEIAHQHGINNSFINWKNKSQAEQMAAKIIDDSQAEIIVLAGFMRILSADFVKQFHRRIINIHPSLLPLYRGLNTHQRAIDDGQKQHGASVHLVDHLLDNGTVLSQTKLDIQATDDAQQLAQRLLPQEHRLLCQTLHWIGTKQLSWNEQTVNFDGQTLHQPLQIL